MHNGVLEPGNPTTAMETAYRLRRMTELLRQMERDYSEVMTLRKRLRSAPEDRHTQAKFSRAMAWLSKEIEGFHLLNGRGIEGVIWGGMRQAEKRICCWQTDIKRNPLLKRNDWAENSRVIQNGGGWVAPPAVSVETAGTTNAGSAGVRGKGLDETAKRGRYGRKEDPVRKHEIR